MHLFAVPLHAGMQGERTWEGGFGKRSGGTEREVLHSKLVFSGDQDRGESR